MNILEFNENLQAVNFEELFTEAVLENSAAFIDTLTEKQMQYGISGNGEHIGEYAIEDYAKAKFQMNSKAGMGFVDLKLTGSFYAGMFMEPERDEFRIDSTDEKTVDLVNKYGGDIMRLTPDNAGMVAHEDVLPDYLKLIREEMKL